MPRDCIPKKSQCMVFLHRSNESQRFKVEPARQHLPPPHLGPGTTLYKFYCKLKGSNHFRFVQICMQIKASEWLSRRPHKGALGCERHKVPPLQTGHRRWLRRRTWSARRRCAWRGPLPTRSRVPAHRRCAGDLLLGVNTCH